MWRRASPTGSGSAPDGFDVRRVPRFNPIQSLLGPTGALKQIPAANAQTLTGKEFFPHLLSGPFHSGLVVVFTAAAVMMVIAAIASLMRGGHYVHNDDDDDFSRTAPAQGQNVEQHA